METVPPFSWHEVATKSDLRALEDRLGERFDGKIDSLGTKLDERTDVLRAEARELHQETIAVLRGELVRNTRQMMYGTVAAMGVVAASIIAAVKL